MKLSFYRTPNGNAPVEKYLDSLDSHEAAPIYAALNDIEENGLDDALAQRRPIKNKLWELKFDQHRIFYVLATGPTLVLLHACKKQSRRARKEDLDVALSRMKEVLTTG